MDWRIHIMVEIGLALATVNGIQLHYVMGGKGL
jgi:hypothetical protein